MTDHDPGAVYGSDSVHHDEHQAAAAAAVAPLAAVPVQVGHDVATAPRAAQYGAWMTYTLAATTPAQRILFYDSQRARALLVISGTGPVFVGTVAQTQATPPQGGQLPAGVYELRNQQELWLAPDGAHTATVAVLAERWSS